MIKEYFMFLLVMLIGVCVVVNAEIKNNSAVGVDPYISYDGLKVDVRNITGAVPQGFIKYQAEENDYYIVKLRGAIMESWHKELERNVEKILWYVPYNAYIVKMDRNQAERVKALPFVYWVGVQQPYFKLARQIREILDSGDYNSIAKEGKIKLMVLLYAGERGENVKDIMIGMEGVEFINKTVNAHATRVVIEVAVNRFAKVVPLIASIKEVEGIEIFQRVEFFNDAGRWVHQRFVSGSYPLYTAGLRGTGQIGGISDSGFDYDMCYFRDTTNFPPPFDLQAPWGDVSEDLNERKTIIYYAMDAATCGQAGSPGTGSSGNDHGTHTLGSFVGDNFATACNTGTGDAGDGMALCSKVVLEDLGANLEFINNPCGTLYDLLSIAYADGARVHTNSWGAPCSPPGNPCGGNLYGADARDIDQFMWNNNDMAIFFAAGNSATSAPNSTICSPGTGKSNATIGSSLHGTSATSISSFSSRGWTYDKRMKPDFICQGSSVVSANNDGSNTSYNCSTITMSGTSMATPTCAGYGLITRQYYVDGYYPTGSPVPANGFNPSGALIKATMLNGSVDMTGVSGSPPNITEGWGRLQLDESLYLSGDARKLWVRDVSDGLTTGMSRCYNVQNNSTSQTLKVTLVWSDYPAAYYADPALVNDLMLEVTDPSGATTYHLRLDASYNIIQTTNPSDPQDDRNPVEQVVVSSPASGVWKVKVKGINIPQPPQKFALVVTGDVADTTQPNAPTGVSASATADNQITVSWSPASGATCYSVYRSMGACPGTLFEQVANCITNTSFVDNNVSGGTTYSYKVTAIYPSSCESYFSSCAQATATGICTLSPEFDGVSAVVNNKTSNCGLTVQWDAATSNCSTFPNVKYTIYKSTDPDFVPGPSNQIATCFSGTSYVDNNVTVATKYYYVVRAEDSRPGGASGPCNGGNFETNVIKRSEAPTGPETILFSDDAGDTGSAQMTLGTQWVISTSRNHTPGGTRSYYSGSGQNNLCSYLTSPSTALNGGAYYYLEYYTTYNLEEGWDAVDVQVSTNGGTSWTKVTPMQGYPASTNTSTSTCIGTAQQCYTGNILPNFAFYSVDLTTLAGQNLLFRYRYGSDDAMNLENFYVDDIKVSALATCTQGVSTPGYISNNLTVAKSGTTNLVLSWQAVGGACTVEAYGVYRGSLPWTGYNHTQLTCQNTTTSYTDQNAPSSYYYLVVPNNSTAEGSYGKDSGGSQIPQSSSPCKTTQNTDPC